MTTPEIPDEAIDAAMEAQGGHVFADRERCGCGYDPPTLMEWRQHRVEVALSAAFPILAERIAAAIDDMCPDFDQEHAGGWCDFAKAAETARLIGGVEL